MPYINMHPSYEFYQGFKNGLLVNTLKGFHFQIDPDMCQLLQKSVGFLDNIILNELEQKALNYLEENHILIREEVLTPKNQAIKPPVKLHALIHQRDLENLPQILNKFEQLSLFDYEIRIDKKLTEQDILYLFQILDHFEIDNLELLVHIPTVNLQKLLDLVETCQFYIDMHVLEANFKERFQNQKVTINPVHGTLDFLTSCGKINKDYFDSTSEGIRESKDHNSCLRGKISIDINGQIKNCPSMNTSFGHFEETNFDEVISNPSFNKQWNINKDSISVCRDCEYRYVCTDCRAFTESGELFGKPLKCRYNPYKGVWEDD